MPLIQINAVADLPSPTNGGDLETVLARALADLPANAPLVVMIHGFKFSPGAGARCPHRHILSFRPDTHDPRAVSWPRHLGFSGTRAETGLAIAFGWQATGNIWRAYRKAVQAGTALAALADAVDAHCPGRRVDVIAHSLGARVALGALPQLRNGQIGRMVLMTPAETGQVAQAALTAPQARGCEILNITSRENDLFDFMLETAVARRGQHSLGQGLGHRHPNWLDLQIDNPATLAALARQGLQIAPPVKKICHWSPFLRPGMFGLYRAFLHGGLPMENLRTCQTQCPEPRWSRLLPMTRFNMPLHFAGKSAT